MAVYRSQPRGPHFNPLPIILPTLHIQDHIMAGFRFFLCERYYFFNHICDQNLYVKAHKRVIVCYENEF